MEHRISTLFFIKKSKPTKDGKLPLYIRITVNGQRIEHGIQRYIHSSQWSVTAGQMKGNGTEARQLNLYLATLISKVLKFERELVQDDKPITFDSFREKWLGIADKPRMLLTLFQEHNDHVAALVQVGSDFAPGTLERYKTARDHTLSFLQWKYKINDMYTSGELPLFCSFCLTFYNGTRLVYQKNKTKVSPMVSKSIIVKQKDITNGIHLSCLA